MNHCLGYLKATPTFALNFFPLTTAQRPQLVAVTDASFGTDCRTRRSCTGYFIYLNNNLISAYSGAQTRVTTSAAEAELTAIYTASKKLQYFKGLLDELDMSPEKISVLTDSAASIQTVHNAVSPRYKFLGIYIWFLKQLIKMVGLKLYFLNRSLNFADLLTKQSATHIFLNLWNQAQPPLQWKHQVFQSREEQVKHQKTIELNTTGVHISTQKTNRPPSHNRTYKRSKHSG